MVNLHQTPFLVHTMVQCEKKTTKISRTSAVNGAISIRNTVNSFVDDNKCRCPSFGNGPCRAGSRWRCCGVFFDGISKNYQLRKCHTYDTNGCTSNVSTVRLLNRPRSPARYPSLHKASGYLRYYVLIIVKNRCTSRVSCASEQFLVRSPPCTHRYKGHERLELSICRSNTVTVTAPRAKPT